MPSRASTGTPGGFSYYEHVVLPESEKTLVWEMDGRRHRSQVVIRSGGRRRTEAYLFAWDGGAWKPAVIADGTVSDGRCDSYTRCVESICGSAETFFTSVFAAQGRRHLSQYRNAEIKGLLADLLGLDEIGQLGSRAQEVVRGLKAGLSALRVRQSELAVEEARVKADLTRLHGAEQAVAVAMKACETARSGCVRPGWPMLACWPSSRIHPPPVSSAHGWKTACALQRRISSDPRPNGSGNKTICASAPSG